MRTQQNNAPDRAADETTKEAAARKAFYVTEISLFLKERRRRLDRHMRPEEIGAARHRGFLLIRSLLDAVAYICREKLFARYDHHIIGVLAWDTFFSDRKDGCSTATADRIAQLLRCDEQKVRRGRAALVEHHLLGCEKRPGLEDRYWPIINRTYAEESVHPTWWLDATSSAPKPRGRPPKNPGHHTGPDLSPEKTPGTSDNPGHQTENPGYLNSQVPEKADRFSDKFASDFPSNNKKDNDATEMHEHPSSNGDARPGTNGVRQPNGTAAGSVAPSLANGSAPTEPIAPGNVEDVPPRALVPVASAANPVTLEALASAAAGITEVDINDWSSQLWAAIEVWSPDPFKTNTAINFDVVRESGILSTIRTQYRKHPRPTDPMIAEAMDKALKDFAVRAKTRRGGRDAALAYFSEVYDTAIGKVWTAEIKRRKELAKAQIEVSQAQTIADTRTANYQQRAIASSAKAKADTDPTATAIETARERGASSLVLDKFCAPMLRQFRSLKGAAAVDWCVTIAEMLADMPEEVLVWAAKNIRDTYKQAFVPPPALIKGGIEYYLQRQQKLGQRFTPDAVFPEWDPDHRSRRREVMFKEIHEEAEHERERAAKRGRDR
jgi:hypothetical protein